MRHGDSSIRMMPWAILALTLTLSPIAQGGTNWAQAVVSTNAVSRGETVEYGGNAPPFNPREGRDAARDVQDGGDISDAWWDMDAESQVRVLSGLLATALEQARLTLQGTTTRVWHSVWWPTDPRSGRSAVRQVAWAALEAYAEDPDISQPALVASPSDTAAKESVWWPTDPKTRVKATVALAFLLADYANDRCEHGDGDATESWCDATLDAFLGGVLRLTAEGETR